MAIVARFRSVPSGGHRDILRVHVATLSRVYLCNIHSRFLRLGGDALLMTMHGTFWRFPKTFSAANSAGIAPRSAYRKVIGDFYRWGERVVPGWDDTAKSEFRNRSRATAKLAAPGQSQSNLWFIAPERLDRLGPPLGCGAVWMDEPMKAGAPSDALLFSGYTHRMVHLTHDAGADVRFTQASLRVVFTRTRNRSGCTPESCTPGIHPAS